MSKARHSAYQRRGIDKGSVYFNEFERLCAGIRGKILRLRQERKLTQEQMQDFELNLRQFQRIESGETKNITLANLFKIAKALKVPIADLLKGI